MHTKDILAEALRQAGLPDMATKAAEGYYHDFLSPLPLPEKQLMHDLQVAKKLSKDERQIDKIRILLESATSMAHLTQVMKRVRSGRRVKKGEKPLKS